MAMTRIIKTFLLNLLLVFISATLLVSCNGVSNQDNISTPVSLPTETIYTPTINPTNTISPTATLDIYRTVDERILSDSQIETLVDNLFVYDPNCELPCWWGITPGSTSWSQAYEVLRPLAWRIHFTEKGNLIRADVVIPYQKTERTVIQQQYWIENGMVALIEIYTIPEHMNSLVNLIEAYGMPDDIILGIWSPLQDKALPYYFIFEEYGILAYLYSPMMVNEDTVELCFFQDEISVFELWSPENQLDFETIVSANLTTLYFPEFNSENFISVEQIGFTPSEFIDMYTDSEECFSLPLDWFEY